MIQVKNLELTYGSRELFRDVNFVVNSGEKIALLGRNGFGKSSLLKILAGASEPTDGEVVVPKGYTIGYLEQLLKPKAKTIITEALLDLEPEMALVCEYQAKMFLSGLGFKEEQFNHDPSTLSGGFQLRLQLVKQLIAAPDLLLLDEPTNYLDILSIRWLSRELVNLPGELIIISHDKSFLEAVSNTAMIIRRKSVKKLSGSIAKLLNAVVEEEEQLTKVYEAEQVRKQEITSFVNRFRAQASKAALVQSRIKELEKLKSTALEKDEATLEFSFNCLKTHSKVLVELKKAQFSYDQKRFIFKNLDLTLELGDRVGIIGPNGYGKSTLLQVLGQSLALAEDGSSGELNFSKNCKLGLFSQTNVAYLDERLSIADTISQTNETLSNTEVRCICGAMLFGGDSALKEIKVLSGGERSRVLLAKILATPTNLLLLDEPTSHLDLESVGALARAVKRFAGTTVVVSHDEDFLNDLNLNKIIYFSPDKTNPELFLGSYQDFIIEIGWNDDIEMGRTSIKSQKSEKNSDDYQKNNSSNKLNHKQSKELAKLERNYDKLSKDKEQLQKELESLSKGSYYQELQKKTLELTTIESKLLELLEQIEMLEAS
jgi:ATP-binding cassette, subfamily F, member 3